MDAVHLHLGVFQDDQFVRRGVVVSELIRPGLGIAKVAGIWPMVIGEGVSKTSKTAGRLQLGNLDPTMYGSKYFKDESDEPNKWMLSILEMFPM